MSVVSTPKSAQSDGKSHQLVKVCVRVRPLNKTESASGSREALKVTGVNTLRTHTAAEGGRKVESQIHKYDRVHPSTSSQEDVFENSGISELCNNAAAGYTATVFAYGQTGSGKTHTLIGPPDGLLSGIIPRSSRYIFEEMIPNFRSSHKIIVRASFIEIYNEQTYDLLSPSEGSLPVRWNAASNSFFVESALVVTCEGLDDLIAILQEGVSNRATASHLLNKDSSRSHSILTVYFESTSQDSVQTAQGKINFVDLAGSERLKDSGSTGGTAVENCHINKSLLALGQVISVLSDRSSAIHNQGTYVPYRDSKLTKLLMDSLGGSCKTVMIACVSPATCYIDETINTLKYANRASCITNCPAVRIQSASAAFEYQGDQNRNNGTNCYDSHIDPSGLHDVVARLQIENERLRSENISLKRRCLANDQNGESTAVVEDHGIGQFKIKPQTRILLNGGPTSNGSSDALLDNSSELYTDSLSSRPVMMSAEDADRVGETDKNTSLITHLKATLARVSCEADCLQSDRESGDCGIAAIVNENIRLVEVLNSFDILKGSLDRRSTPKRTDRRVSSPDMKAASQTIRELRVKVSQLENNIKHLTTSEAPSQKQHIIERRELRLQKETNSLLRIQLARTRVQKSQTKTAIDEDDLIIAREPSPPSVSY